MLPSLPEVWHAVVELTAIVRKTVKDALPAQGGDGRVTQKFRWLLYLQRKSSLGGTLIGATI